MAREGHDDPSIHEPIPRSQAAFDNVFLLLAAGLVVPTVFFIAWGLVSLLAVPPFPR